MMVLEKLLRVGSKKKGSGRFVSKKKPVKKGEGVEVLKKGLVTCTVGSHRVDLDVSTARTVQGHTYYLFDGVNNEYLSECGRRITIIE